MIVCSIHKFDDSPFSRRPHRGLDLVQLNTYFALFTPQWTCSTPIWILLSYPSSSPYTTCFQLTARSKRHHWVIISRCQWFRSSCAPGIRFSLCKRWDVITRTIGVPPYFLFRTHAAGDYPLPCHGLGMIYSGAL